MCELLWITILVSSNDYLVLHLHDNGVEGSEEKHEAHDRIKGAWRDSFALLFSLYGGIRSS